jgi:NTE family protein
MGTSLLPNQDPTPTPPTKSAPLPSLEQGTALSLSGGGYRAMLFHLGSLWRLNEVGLLQGLACISSVSGGSITAAALGMRWKELEFEGGTGKRLIPAVIEPVRELARHTIDVGSIAGGLLNPFSTIAGSVASAYRQHLFGTRTLQDLPDTSAPAPRFVINSCNVQTGALWRFSREYMGDYRTGRVTDPDVELAVAVGASSAFPPFLSPVHLSLPDGAVRSDPGSDLHRPPFTTRIVLSDGGVYDNLGLEPIFKRYKTVLVSDAGAQLAPEEEPSSDWARHSRRVIDLVDHQVRSLRKRVLIEAYRDGTRLGAYWGIATDIANYQLNDMLDCPVETTCQLAEVPTRLAALTDDLQERLINWGYAVCDAALRKHVNPELPRPAGFPYPRGV